MQVLRSLVGRQRWKSTCKLQLAFLNPQEKSSFDVILFLSNLTTGGRSR
jgi:hypothetical protein